MEPMHEEKPYELNNHLAPNDGEKTFALLPREVFQMILQYLPLKDVSKMDMAIVNHNLRSHLLFTLNEWLIPSFEENEYDWIMLRNIKPKHFRQHHCHDCEDHYCDDRRCYSQSHIDIVPFLLKVSDHLESLSLDGISKSDFRKLGAFPELTSFSLSLLRSPVSTKSLTRFFGLSPKLKRLDLNFSFYNYNVTLLTALISNCPNLRHLNLANNMWFNDHCVAKLTRSNLDLFLLNIDYTAVTQDESLQLILNAFPNLQHLSFGNCEGISLEMNETCVKQVAIRSLLSDDPDIQNLGFSCLHSYFHPLASGETGYPFPITDTTLDSIMKVVIPLLQNSVQNIRRCAFAIFTTMSTIIIDNNYIPKIFEYAQRHPEVLEPCDALRCITEFKYSKKEFRLRKVYLLESYNALRIKQMGPTNPLGLEIEVISFYEEEDSPELIVRKNLLQTSETHCFFLNIVDYCLSYEPKTLLKYLVNSGVLSSDGKVVNHKPDMPSEWRLELARRLRGMWVFMP